MGINKDQLISAVLFSNILNMNDKKITELIFYSTNAYFYSVYRIRNVRT